MTDQYQLTPEEHAKYHPIFVQYDSDMDGYISAAEANQLFIQAKIHGDAIKTIFTLADYDKDNRLAPKEFCVAFHLIICITRKNLQLPSLLPNTLKYFLEKGPSVPVPGIPISAYIPPVSAPAPVAASLSSAFPPVASMPFPTAAPVTPPVAMTIPQPTNNIPIAPQPSSPAVSFPQHHAFPPQQPVAVAKPAPVQRDPPLVMPPVQLGPTIEEQNQPIKEVSNTYTEATKLLETSADATNKVTAALKGTLQKIKDENKSLKSTVSVLKKQTEESNTGLETISRDIAVAVQTLSELRERHATAQTQYHNLQGKLNEKQTEKQVLMQKIDDMRKSIEAGGQEITVVQDQVKTVAQDKATMQSKSQNMASLIDEKKRDVQSMAQEVDQLQSILTNLTATRQAQRQQVNKLQFDLGEVKLSVVKEKTRYKTQCEEVARLRETENQLRHQVETLFQQINTLYSTPLDIPTVGNDHDDDDEDDDDEEDIVSSPSQHTTAVNYDPVTEEDLKLVSEDVSVEYQQIYDEPATEVEEQVVHHEEATVEHVEVIPVESVPAAVAPEDEFAKSSFDTFEATPVTTADPFAAPQETIETSPSGGFDNAFGDNAFAADNAFPEQPPASDGFEATFDKVDTPAAQSNGFDTSFDFPPATSTAAVESSTAGFENASFDFPPTTTTATSEAGFDNSFAFPETTPAPTADPTGFDNSFAFPPTETKPSSDGFESAPFDGGFASFDAPATTTANTDGFGSNGFDNAAFDSFDTKAAPAASSDFSFDAFGGDNKTQGGSPFDNW